jgi:hypothetical protein
LYKKICILSGKNKEINHQPAASAAHASRHIMGERPGPPRPLDQRWEPEDEILKDFALLPNQK